MPTYEYRCVSCEHQFERFQRMSDDPITECEVCGQAVKRLLFPVAIHFKGSGFYSTDYGKNTKSSVSTGSSGNGSSAESASSACTSSSASATATAEKPAEKSGSVAAAASSATKTD